LSQTVKVEVGSSAPLIAMIAPLADVGVPLRVIVVVTEERVDDAIPCHSSRCMLKPAGLIIAREVPSNVIPGADGRVEVETEIVSGFVSTTRRMESEVEVVERPVIVKVVPELQVPVFFELEFASIVGLAASAILFTTVDVEVVPGEVDSPLHRVPQVPTVVVFV